jgi:hypothetical protein
VFQKQSYECVSWVGARQHQGNAACCARLRGQRGLNTNKHKMRLSVQDVQLLVPNSAL